MTAAALEFRGLAKDYGDVRALRGIDLRVDGGEIFGFLGPNGAGKSTAIRIALDLIRPSAGTASMFGFDCQSDPVRARAHAGYLSSEPAFPPGLTAEEVFAYSAALRGRSIDTNYVGSLTERLQLDTGRKVQELSRGNRQKVGLVQALMHRSALVILDEPTTGLDPVVQQEVEAILRQVAADGRTVFFSSHILAEVEAICSRATILREGSIVSTFNLDEQRRLAPMRVDVAFQQPPGPGAFDDLPSSIDVVRGEGSSVRFEVHDGMDALVKALGRYPVESLSARKPTLEELFLDYYRTEPAQGASE